MAVFFLAKEIDEKNAFKSDDVIFVLLRNLNSFEYADIVRVDNVAGTFM
jgi:hypothetical protein